MTSFRSTLDKLVTDGLAGVPTDRDALMEVMASGDEHLLDVVVAAARLRRHHFANRVKLNYLVNLKSGLCPEDCGYCSQRLGSTADVLKYSWLKPQQAATAAAAGIDAGAVRVCLVASGRGPSDRDIDRVGDIVEAIRDRAPGVEVCACLGLLADGQADRLADTGVDAYNHNLNTSDRRYGTICTTHDFADRVDTVDRAKSAGLSPCSGLIAGMGETDADIVDVLMELRRIGSASVPVNFLIPFEGTPLAGTWDLTPQRCLRILAAARFACPGVEVRVGAGREVHLRSLQPLALHVANSIFLGDYLTSEGQAGKADLAMIADNGFVLEGAEDTEADASTAGARTELVRPRKRGAGTALAPNT
ncbi:biotin synthase [Stackebrandtia endophytica]|uniref:Biotin synthase n=1 Tax=Stackebrandtia endophytica TaxID=1496996 RepID=A0A543B405_9ACTN|nr:biotin synthase BioB [Stackebrandtia endophytica]TQL79568.1 biotin synthase [Stackebrandtia endophytica]